MEEAHAFQALLDRGWTREDLAQKMGFKQPWRIEWRTSLLNLSPEYQVMAARNELVPAQAYHASTLPKELQPVFVRRSFQPASTTSRLAGRWHGACFWPASRRRSSPSRK